MADPICRWRNATIKQIVEFTNILPHKPMPKEEAHKYVEKLWNTWDGGNNFFKTPYQLAAQLGLYYEDREMLYPRFDHAVTIEEAKCYINKWIRLYYVPNPYTASIPRDNPPIVLNNSLYQEAGDNGIDLDIFFKIHFNVELGNKDILANVLNQFSDVYISQGVAIRKEARYPIANREIPTSSTDKKAFFTWFGKEELNAQKFHKHYDIDSPRQVIYYGAPGTGKSFDVNEKTRGHSVIRTTFHPDSDYSTFVGAYKPIMEEQEARVLPVVLGTGATFDTNNGTYKEKRIVYKFVKQAFLKAYLSAWQKYADGKDIIESQFLVIEEINRGNCAQIFGDLFQLLDRENGFSKYPIEADDDLRREIDFAFNSEQNENEGPGEYRLSAALNIDSVIPGYESAYGATLSEDVRQGRVLLLPPNLYIWATMNTSDQSLFPIDSAFKRRWEWKYVKISEGFKKENGEFVKDASGNRIPLGWEIAGSDYRLDWWKFVQAINNHISDATSSDDKKLGYFFCKPTDGISINEETFAGKVLFYLWNDVFKDNDNRIFIVEDGQKEASFDVFYTEDENTGLSRPDSANILQFLKNVMGDAGKSYIIETKPKGSTTETTDDNSNSSEDTDIETE